MCNIEYKGHAHGTIEAAAYVVDFAGNSDLAISIMQNSRIPLEKLNLCEDIISLSILRAFPKTAEFLKIEPHS